MTFDEWFNKEVPKSRGYLVKTPKTIASIVDDVEKSTENLPAGAVDVRAMLRDAYLEGYNQSYEDSFPDRPR